MASVMTCPDCGREVEDGDDLIADRRVHRLSVADDGAVAVERTETVALWRCDNCDIVLGVS